MSSRCTCLPALLAQSSINWSNSCSGWRMSISSTKPFRQRRSYKYSAKCSCHCSLVARVLWQSRNRVNPPGVYRSPQCKYIDELGAAGVLLVRASLPLLVRVLMALDLPALERPAKATSTPLSGGHWARVGALMRNCAVRKLMVAGMESPRGTEGVCREAKAAFKPRSEPRWNFAVQGEL